MTLFGLGFGIGVLSGFAITFFGFGYLMSRPKDDSSENLASDCHSCPRTDSAEIETVVPEHIDTEMKLIAEALSKLKGRKLKIDKDDIKKHFDDAKLIPQAQWESHFSNLIEEGKDREKQLRLISTFFNEVSRCYSISSKNLSKVLIQTQHNYNKTNPDKYWKKWFPAILSDVHKIALDEETLADTLAKDTVTFFTTQTEDQSNFIKHLSVEGNNLIQTLRELKNNVEVKSKELDKYQNQLDAALSKSSVMPQSNNIDVQTNKLWQKIEIVEKSLNDAIQRLNTHQQYYNTTLPKVIADLHLVAFKSALESKSQLKKFIENLQKVHENHLNLAQDLRVKIMSPFLPEGSTDISTELMGFELGLVKSLQGMRLQFQQANINSAFETIQIAEPTSSDVIQSTKDDSSAWSSTPPSTVQESDGKAYTSGQQELTTNLSAAKVSDQKLSDKQQQQQQHQNNLYVGSVKTSGSVLTKDCYLDMYAESTAVFASCSSDRLPKLPESFNFMIGKESCVWLNAFLGRIYRDCQRSSYFQYFLVAKATSLLNKGTLPGFVDEFIIDDVSLGPLPPTFCNMKWIPVVKSKRNSPESPASMKEQPNNFTNYSMSAGTSTTPTDTMKLGKSNMNSPEPNPGNVSANSHDTLKSSSNNSNFGGNTPAQPQPQSAPTNDTHDDYDVQVAADFAFRSELKIKVSTKVFLNWPRERFVAVPISLTIVLDEISGKMIFGCDRESCYASFEEEPFTRIQIITEVGDKFKLNDIPNLSAFLTNKMKQTIRNKLVYPNRHREKFFWPRYWWPEGTHDKFPSFPLPTFLPRYESLDSKTKERIEMINTLYMIQFRDQIILQYKGKKGKEKYLPGHRIEDGKEVASIEFSNSTTSAGKDSNAATGNANNDKTKNVGNKLASWFASKFTKAKVAEEEMLDHVEVKWNDVMENLKLKHIEKLKLIRIERARRNSSTRQVKVPSLFIQPLPLRYPASDEFDSLGWLNLEMKRSISDDLISTSDAKLYSIDTQANRRERSWTLEDLRSEHLDSLAVYLWSAKMSHEPTSKAPIVKRTVRAIAGAPSVAGKTVAQSSTKVSQTATFALGKIKAISVVAKTKVTQLANTTVDNIFLGTEHGNSSPYSNPNVSSKQQSQKYQYSLLQGQHQMQPQSEVSQSLPAKHNESESSTQPVISVASKRTTDTVIIKPSEVISSIVPILPPSDILSTISRARRNFKTEAEDKKERFDVSIDEMLSGRQMYDDPNMASLDPKFPPTTSDHSTETNQVLGSNSYEQRKMPATSSDFNTPNSYTFDQNDIALVGISGSESQPPILRRQMSKEDSSKNDYDADEHQSKYSADDSAWISTKSVNDAALYDRKPAGSPNEQNSSPTRQQHDQPQARIEHGQSNVVTPAEATETSPAMGFVNRLKSTATDKGNSFLKAFDKVKKSLERTEI